MSLKLALQNAAENRVFNQLNDLNFTVLELIKELEFLLTNSDERKRAIGMEIVCHCIPQCELTPNDVILLEEFFLSRLDDVQSVGSILHGLYLLRHFSFSILKRIYSQVTIQSLSRNERLFILDITSGVFQQDLQTLKSESHIFIKDFTLGLEGEKDPECLLRGFDIIRLIVKHLNFEKHVSELLEVTLCYYPITFQATNEMKITAEELKTGLRNVLSCTAMFRKTVMETLKDKIGSSAASVRRDVMDTLVCCIPVYGKEAIMDDLRFWWNALKKEVSGTNPENQMSALKAMREISKELSIVTIVGKSPIDTWLKLICDEIKDCIESDLMYNAEYGKVIMAVGTGSYHCFDYIVSACLQLSIDRLSDSKISVQKGCLQIIHDILVCLNLVYPRETNDMELSTPVSNFNSVLISNLLSKSIAVGEIKTLALNSIGELLKSDVNETEIVTLATTLVKAAENSEDGQLCLKSLSTKPVINSIIPILENEISVNSKLLGAYSAIAVGAFHDSISNLSKWLVVGLGRNQMDLVTLVLQTLDQCFRLDNQEFSNEFALLEIILNPVYIETLFNAQFRHYSTNIIHAILPLVGKEYIILTRQHQFILNHLLELQNHIDPNYQNEIMMYLFSAIVGFLKPNLNYADLDLVQVCGHWINSAAENGSTFIQSVGITIGSLVNKNYLNDDYAKLFFESYIVECELKELFKNRLLLFAWVVKGLTVKRSPIGVEYLTKLTELVTDPQYGFFIPECISIVNGHSIYFTKQSSAIIKILHQQKMYELIMEKLLSIFHQNPNCIPCLIAVSQIADPKYGIEKVVPMLLISLKIDDQALLESSLKSLCQLVNEKPMLIDLSSLLTRVLHILGKRNTYNVRLLAAKLLGNIVGQYDSTELLRSKDDVLAVLGNLINDHKRGIRKEAGNSRMKWFLLAA